MNTIREPENPQFPEVFSWGLNDYLLGGETGPLNRQAIALVERTAYLKQIADTSAERIGENEKNINANTAALNHLNNIVVVADNEGRLGLVTGEKELADRSTDGMINVLPSGKMKLIGYESLMPRIVGTTVESHRELNPWELAKHRLLEPNYQLIEIAKYQELCDFMYCGNENNNTTLWWYKCDHLGNRTITGLFMRVIDRRGLFARCAGANAAVRPSDNTLYDGGNAGNFISDAIRNIQGTWRAGWGLNPLPITYVSGAITGDDITANFMFPSTTGTSTQRGMGRLDPSRVVPVANENRPASISLNYYIVY